MEMRRTLNNFIFYLLDFAYIEFTFWNFKSRNCWFRIIFYRIRKTNIKLLGLIIRTLINKKIKEEEIPPIRPASVPKQIVHTAQTTKQPKSAQEVFQHFFKSPNCAKSEKRLTITIADKQALGMNLITLVKQKRQKIMRQGETRLWRAVRASIEWMIEEERDTTVRYKSTSTKRSSRWIAREEGTHKVSSTHSN